MLDARGLPHPPDDEHMNNKAESRSSLGLAERRPIHWTVAVGPVESVHQGLSCCSIRIRIGEQISLRVRCPSDSDVGRATRLGQEVAVMIPANGVFLAVPAVWPGTDRWNRWRGRIVMVEMEPETVLTVKVRGVQWTLRSTEPVMGLARRPQTGDPANIAVDPTLIRLMRKVSSINSRFIQPETYDRRSFAAGGLVRMKGRIIAVRQAAHGWLLSLEIGNAHVSAMVGEEGQAHRSWMASMDVELQMSERETWMKPLDHDLPPVPCSLFYPSADASSVQRMTVRPVL